MYNKTIAQTIRNHENEITRLRKKQDKDLSSLNSEEATTLATNSSSVRSNSNKAGAVAIICDIVFLICFYARYRYQTSRAQEAKAEQVLQTGFYDSRPFDTYTWDQYPVFRQPHQLTAEKRTQAPGPEPSKLPPPQEQEEKRQIGFHANLERIISEKQRLEEMLEKYKSVESNPYPQHQHDDTVNNTVTRSDNQQVHGDTVKLHGSLHGDTVGLNGNSEEEDADGKYKIHCKCCGKEAWKRSPRAEFCTDSCRFKYNNEHRPSKRYGDTTENGRINFESATSTRSIRPDTR
ncbi:hypothetical protein V6R21_06425 [Limibacter armeniacum]|uniref:hypothetical protein n=1 Tax=Limibacter armeniacum TaxID=466084 RepID=UPI002FE674A2